MIACYPLSHVTGHCRVIVSDNVSQIRSVLCLTFVCVVNGISGMSCADLTDACS